MLGLLARVFIEKKDLPEKERRQVYGMLCARAGIGFNIILFLLKFLAGALSGSLAMMADGLNNLSDSGSSIVTLLGFRLAGQKADAEHPFGHGRAEYLSGLAVSVLILLMGWELVKNAFARILHPAEIQVNAWIVSILCVSIGIKLYMWYYNHSYGKRFHAPALLAAATDSLGDCAATAAVLGSTVVDGLVGFSVDGWCGMLVALFIMYSGIHVMRDTVNPLLGMPPDHEFVRKVRELVLEHPMILGVHDILVHDYGPGRRMVSLHVEVPSSEGVLELHDAVDHAERELREKLGCETVIHMDPIVTDDGITQETRQRVEALIQCIAPDIEIHDFRMIPGSAQIQLFFEALVPYSFPLSDEELVERIQKAVKVLDERYCATVTVEKSHL